jgi:Methyltransferase domain
MENADRKRPREGEDEHSTTVPIPPYGSQEYWENRYKRQQTHSNKLGDSEDQPVAFHAWYFTYDELAPLILPLIIGDADVEAKDADDDNSDLASKERDTTSPTLTDSTKVFNGEATEGNTGGTVQGDEMKEDDTGDGDGNEDVVEVENDSDVDGALIDDEDVESLQTTIQGDKYELVEVDISEDEEAGLPRRIGLSKCGPIEVLEVGCGDVPLGNDILFGISEWAKATVGMSTSPSNVVKRVVCVDYSENVIEALKTKQKGSSSPTMIPLEYECKDARKLPYESGRFKLILEKGTMDAMLSEPDVGADNCRAIVAEMARLVAIEGMLYVPYLIARFLPTHHHSALCPSLGVIMVISHLNAHTEDGMQWFNDIVVPGLRMGSISTKWSIEVHGGEVPDIPDDHEGDDEISSGNPGPAVYIIHKGETFSSVTAETELPPVSLQFFSY